MPKFTWGKWDYDCSDILSYIIRKDICPAPKDIPAFIVREDDLPEYYMRDIYNCGVQGSSSQTY